MHTIKLFLNMAKPFTLVSMLFSVMMMIQVIVFIMTDNPHKSVDNIYHSVEIMMIGFIIGVCCIVPKTMTGTNKTNNKNTRYALPFLPLTPLSLKSKFIMMSMLALTATIAIILFSLPMELIGYICSQSESPEKQMVVGGLILHLAQEGILPVLLAEVSFAVLCGTLFRNILCIFVPLILISVGNSEFVFSADNTFLHTMPGYGLCLLVAAVCLLLSYQIFKRWQIANSGVFMI